MSDLGKLLDEYRAAAAACWEGEGWSFAVNTARAAIESHVAELRNCRDNYRGLFDELCEQVAQMCEHLGLKRDEVPCDAWQLRDAIVRLRIRAEQAEAKLARVRAAIEKADLTAMNPRNSCMRCSTRVSDIAGAFREALGEP